MAAENEKVFIYFVPFLPSIKVRKRRQRSNFETSSQIFIKGKGELVCEKKLWRQKNPLKHERNGRKKKTYIAFTLLI
jgi:hypothetical protein